MRKKKLMSIILAAFAFFSILSISKTIKYYANKPIKMIYYLRDNENKLRVAARFGIKAEDIKSDGRYLMFEVR
jgi:hypothetical protein